MSEHVSFDRFRFEPLTARLWADEREIKLTPKAAAVLGLLVAHAGQPVPKQELFAAVWRGTIVGDDALTTCIQELRKALGDDAKQPRYIETRHRVGYRFLADVMDPRTRWIEPSSGQLATIAVLPFTDMSPVHDQDYFCDGLAEELIDALCHVDGLRVASRSAAFQFRGPGLDVREVGRRLGVSALLEGSVRKAGDRLRITVQLIDVDSGYHRWSQRFERELGDVFAIQDEIAATVATTLRGGALSQRERRALQRPQTAAETYECYLRGRQCLHRMHQPDLDRGRELFEQAIALDADYAPAWAGLAAVHAMLCEWWGARDEDLDRAERASQTAMQLAPDLADAHVARGLALTLRGRYEEAERCFERAAQINPYLFDAYYYCARSCFAHGAIERSVELFRKAAEVRREDFQSSILLAQSLRMLGRSDAASAASHEGVLRAERVLALNPLDERALSIGSLALLEDGQKERALEWSRRSLELYPDHMSALINAGCLHARLGHKEQAMDALERAFGRGWGKRDWIEHDPDYDAFRDDPRFQRLMARLR